MRLKTDDRKFLARISALNTILGKIAFPIIEGSITAEQQRKLGNELMAIGEEFLQRADSCCESELTTIDSHVVIPPKQSSRHSMNDSSASSFPQTPEQGTRPPSSRECGTGGASATTGMTTVARSHSATRPPSISSSHSEIIVGHT